MNKAAPWSIKGVDFDAREAAKEAARRAGMSLGEWLNDVISDQARDLGVAFEDVDEDHRLEAVTARLATLSDGRRPAPHDDPDEDDAPPRRTSRRGDPSDDEISRGRRRVPAPSTVRSRDYRETAYEAAEREEPRAAGGSSEALLETAIRLYERGASRNAPSSEETARFARLEARLEAMARDQEAERAERSERSMRGVEQRLQQIAERIDTPAPTAPAPAPAPAEDMLRIEAKLNRLIDSLSRAPAVPPAAAPIAPPAAPIAPPQPPHPVAAPISPRPAPRSARAPVASIDEAVAQIQQRQRDLAGGPRARRAAQRRDMGWETPTSAAPPAFDVATLRRELSAIHQRLDATHRAVVSRLDEPQAAERAPSKEFDALRQRIEDMSASLGALAPRESVTSIETAIRGLDRRVEDSLGDGPRQALLQPIESLAGDLRRGLAGVASNEGVEKMERAIRDLEVRIEQGRDGLVDTRALDDIQAQTRDIRDLLQRAAAKPAPTESLERQLARLTDRLDRMGRTGDPDAPAMPASPFQPDVIELLATRIDDLGRKIDDAVSQSGADQLDVIAHRIDEVRDSLAARAEAVVSAVDTSALESMMRDIARKLERPAAPAAATSAADTARLEDMLRAMGARAEQASDGGGQKVVEQLRDEVARLADVVETGDKAKDFSALDDIRREMSRLSSLAASSQPGSGEGAIADLRTQIDALARRFDRVDESARALGSLETAIGDLTHRIDDARMFASDAAEAAAREAARLTLDEVLDRLPAGGAPPAALTHELADLRAKQDTIDRRTHSTLTAVHETLEKVVDRIAVLEEEIGDARGGLLAAGDAPVFAPASPVSTLGASPAPPPVAPPEPAFKRGFDELIEPGAGFTRDPEPDAPTAKPSEARRLLDAARRAAQANASHFTPRAPAKETAPDKSKKNEARASEKAKLDRVYADVAAKAQAARDAWAGGSEAGTEGGGPLTRVTGFIVDRKYPLMVAAISAIVLFGSWQLLAKRVFGSHAEAVDVTGAAPQSLARPAATAKLAAPAKREESLLDPSIPSAASGGAAQPPAPPASAKPPVDPAPTASIGQTAFGGGLGLQAAAAKGDAAAQYELGSRYADGRTVVRNANTAFDWLMKAAKQNLAPAQYRVGSFYERGTAGERDLAKAREWYQRAAAAGNVRAMHNMAVLSAEGVDGKPDYATAAAWFRQAADHGVRDSQYNLAILYARGLGIEQDLPLSWAWFAIAAAQGDADAAKKQQDVGGRLDSKQMDLAKAYVAGFKAKPDERSANEAPQPPGGWDPIGIDTQKAPSAGGAKSKAKVTAL